MLKAVVFSARVEVYCSGIEFGLDVKITPVKLISLSMGNSPTSKAIRLRIEIDPELREKLPPETLSFMRLVGFSEVSGKILKIPFLLPVNVLSSRETSPTPYYLIWTVKFSRLLKMEFLIVAGASSKNSG